jgi:hypothetical protein
MIRRKMTNLFRRLERLVKMMEFSILKRALHLRPNSHLGVIYTDLAGLLASLSLGEFGRRNVGQVVIASPKTCSSLLPG